MYLKLYCIVRVQLHSQLEIQFGGLQADYDNLKAQMDEEAEGAATLKTQLQKSQAEYQTLKSKYDKDVSARADELDEMRSVAYYNGILFSIYLSGKSVKSTSRR